MLVARAFMPWIDSPGRAVAERRLPAPSTLFARYFITPSLRTRHVFALRYGPGFVVCPAPRFTPWCNGSTRVFEALCHGSNQCGVAPGRQRALSSGLVDIKVRV